MNLIQNHAILLKDRVRMEAYKKAIEAVVRPGDTVLDIGCGLGILSFLAISAGAAKVHAVEVEPNTLALAKIMAKENGLDKKIIFHKGISTSLNLKEKVDVIVSELFGNLAFNENMLPVLLDAKNRLLKKNGKIIPEGVRLFFAPVEHEEWRQSLLALNDSYSFKFLPPNEMVDLGFPTVSIKPNELLAKPEVASDLDIYSTKTKIVKTTSYFNVERDGILNGFAGWFEARLTKDISFTTSPFDKSTHWGQGFLPLKEVQGVVKGGHITFKTIFEPDDSPVSLNSIVSYHYESK